VREREDEWTGLMRSAISGDDAAYHRLLKAVTPVLRAAARRGLARAGQPVDQSEDIVQDILLAVHLKRHTWDANAPFAPWLFAIARNRRPHQAGPFVVTFAHTRSQPSNSFGFSYYYKGSRQITKT